MSAGDKEFDRLMTYLKNLEEVQSLLFTSDMTKEIISMASAWAKSSYECGYKDGKKVWRE